MTRRCRSSCPSPRPGRWQLVLDTGRPAAEQPQGEMLDVGAAVELPGRSLRVLLRVEQSTGKRGQRAVERDS